MTSIKTKLAIGLTIFLVIAFGILAGLNYWQTKNILMGQIEKELSLSAESYSKDISSWLGIVTTEMAASARSPVFLTEDKVLIKAFVDQEMSRNKLFENFLLFKPNGDYQAYALKQEAGNLAQREYFKQAIKGNIYISNPITSVGTGKPVSMVGIPVKSGGQTTGAIAIPINVDDIQNTVLKIKLAKTGYGFAVANDGTIIMHPDKELVGKSNLFTDFPILKDAHNKALAGEKNIATYVYHGEEQYITFEPINGTTWFLAITVPVSEVSSVLNSYAATSGITVVIVLVIVLVLAIVCIFLFTNQIVKPLHVLGEVAERISKGDLSVNRVNVTSKDELGRLARTFETMTYNLRELIRHIGDSSEMVSSSSEELTGTVRQSAEISTHVASSIADTAKESEVQVKIVGNALDLVRKIEAGARERAQELSNTVEISQKAVRAANDGNQAVDTAVSQMNSIRNTVDNSAQVVAELGERSKEIGQIIEAIYNIAGQTNLLALNAAIEAARAGEQGRGFAVVADEVRKLAEQSQEAAKQISMLIGHIQTKTNEAVKAMDSGTQEVRRGTEVVDRAGQSFRDIDTHVKEVANIAQQAAAGINQLVDDNNAVLEAMQRAGDISRNISTLAQTISTATEEQSASMGDIATASQHLAQLADQLQTEIAQFKV